MGGLPSALRNVVAGLTAQFGERVALRSLTQGKFVASENKVAKSTLLWDDVPAAVTEVKYSSPGSRVQVGDKVFLLSAGSMVPEGIVEGSWEVEFAGVTYRVILAEPVRLSGVNISYRVTARGPSGK